MNIMIWQSVNSVKSSLKSYPLCIALHNILDSKFAGMSINIYKLLVSEDNNRPNYALTIVDIWKITVYVLAGSAVQYWVNDQTKFENNICKFQNDCYRTY